VTGALGVGGSCGSGSVLNRCGDRQPLVAGRVIVSAVLAGAVVVVIEKSADSERHPNRERPAMLGPSPSGDLRLSRLRVVGVQ
jgi:hypothetical protein